MRQFVLSILLVIIASYPAYGASPNNDPESFCLEYLDAVQAQDWPKAREFWLPEELEKSSRLGITYENIPAKYDCTSALVTNPDKTAADLIHVSLEDIDLTGDKAEFNVQQIYKSDTVQTKYYAQKMNGRWYLVSSMYAYAGDWKKYITQFANIYCNDQGLVNEYGLDALDDFISRTGRALGMDSAGMALLEKEKLDYYLCSENDFEKLTGYNAHGITNLPLDAVITRHLPHTHEITHFMINFALQDLPLYTLPLMQEGLAVALGGRWGKSPDVMDELGFVLLRNKICSLDELLTFDNFNIDLGMPDISYPVSGLFVDYLLDKLSVDEFKSLYLELSGSLDRVRSWDRAYVVAAFEKHLKSSWDLIKADFTAFSQKYDAGNINAATADPAWEPVRLLDSLGCHVRIYEGGNDYYVAIDSLPDSTWGTIFLSDSSQEVSATYRSGLFYEQTNGGAYAGQMYALRFNSEEAGLYNYYSDVLEAKYIRSFYPDSRYWDPEKRTIRFRLKKDLLPKPIERYDLRLSL